MNASHHTRARAVGGVRDGAQRHLPGRHRAGETCADKETEAAAWGTCAHQIAERCLRGRESTRRIGSARSSEAGNFEFVIDDEMANCSQVYVDYCRGRLAAYKAETGHDSGVLDRGEAVARALNPPIDAGGTGDFVMYFPLWRMLEIVDLKGGRGVVVKAAGNMQERTYAIGSLLSLIGISSRHIRSTIVQPRVGDGKPTSETFHVAELVDWTVDLLERMRPSKQALTEFEALDGSRIAFDAWAENWLTTGACTFCPRRHLPEAAQGSAVDHGRHAKRWFEEPTTDQPLVVGNAPEIASPEELAHWLDGLEALESWIKAVRGHAHAAAERGVAIPGWVIVDKIGRAPGWRRTRPSWRRRSGGAEADDDQI